MYLENILEYVLQIRVLVGVTVNHLGVKDRLCGWTSMSLRFMSVLFLK